jgi:hypothetical protein
MFIKNEQRKNMNNNIENEITEEEILKEFLYKLLKDMKDLPPEFSKTVDEHF